MTISIRERTQKFLETLPKVWDETSEKTLFALEQEMRSKSKQRIFPTVVKALACIRDSVEMGKSALERFPRFKVIPMRSLTRKIALAILHGGVSALIRGREIAETGRARLEVVKVGDGEEVVAKVGKVRRRYDGYQTGETENSRLLKDKHLVTHAGAGRCFLGTASCTPV